MRDLDIPGRRGDGFASGPVYALPVGEPPHVAVEYGATHGALAARVPVGGTAGGPHAAQLSTTRGEVR